MSRPLDHPHGYDNGRPRRRLYDEIKVHRRQRIASEWTLIFMWLAVGAAFGWGSGAAAIVVFGICFLIGVAAVIITRRQR